MGRRGQGEVSEFEVDFRVVGVDEAGRGPIFGPVVAAAVFFLEPTRLDGVRDSKALTPKARRAIFERIAAHAQFGVGLATPEEIDVLNILHATELAMNRALEMLLEKLTGTAQFESVLVDGKNLKLAYPSRCVVKGDAKVYQIAAASIVAKVYRDELIERLDGEFAAYKLSKNKGYPTKDHLEALGRFGPTPMHRLTFGPVLETLNRKTLDSWLDQGVISQERYESVLEMLEVDLFGNTECGKKNRRGARRETRSASKQYG